MHQCRTSDMKKKFIEGLKTVKPKYDLTQEKIIRYVQNGKLFGILLWDIETPEELKPKFEEFCPIFKNNMVPREDIGEHMREYTEPNNVFKKPRRMLIGSYFGKEILLITPLVKYVLSTMGVSKESICKFLIGNRFHVKLRILSPYMVLGPRPESDQSLRIYRILPIEML